MSSGHVVVVLASASGTQEMGEFLVKSGLLAVSGLEPVTGQPLYNAGWLDAVGHDVLSPFLAMQASAAFKTPEAEGSKLSFVVKTAAEEPVVIHKVVVGD